MELSELVGRAAVFKDASDYARTTQAINLSQGVPEPRFDDEMNTYLCAEAALGWQYADPRGDAHLRSSIAAHYCAQGDNFNTVLVTSGCTESLYIALQAANVEFGNHVAFFAPFYPYYPGLAKLCGLTFTPIAMTTDADANRVDWDLVETSLRAGVKILLINTPHNPTGWCMGQDDWLQLDALSERYHFLTIVDEAYKYYTYEQRQPSTTRTLSARLLIAGSTSKMLSMTGARIGWLAGDPETLEQAYAHHLYLSYCQPPPLQRAVASILDGLDASRIQTLQEHYRRKRDRLTAALSNAGFRFSTPEGGHYVMADYSLIKPHLDARTFSRYMAEQVGVMPLTAEPFYMSSSPRQVRFSFSVSNAVLDEACGRMEAM
ncbi:aminotransferase [Pseudomonas floridensis]|uniref:Aminotransferase n=1 Tax=Pseudomonas floridensis TaxID=1958950 RepID=A0A1X0MZL1_9PSED|nr:pyridoxal phosphate-dependent aminotransferase [Pseudomonas floridensis]ORC55155.1 aminotransferase [Pseudomonas floridensis]